ncbi:lipase [Frankia sp. ACN1ag]|uniref:lipase n=1 Tax=Frankia sp. ACN1ag TaxID=102891 RepID=UPI0006DBDEFE|nr:lipase [Frankia sp. ACN1ag]KQC38350.1 lipase [Frankia sp. ACN1ag]
MPRGRWFGLATAVVLAAVAAACSTGEGSASAQARSAALAREVAGPVGPPDAARLPLLFVHGTLGSGDQFESQAQRFTSNGYPADRISAFDYDASSWGNPLDKVFPQLDTKIQDLLRATGAKKVDLVGQAEGAELTERYLASSASRAGRVAHLISVEGSLASGPPRGVPMLTVWGTGDPTRRVPGASNVRFPDQERNRLLTSTGTFREMFRFLTGTEPFTTDVVAEKGQIEISGRALLFPANTGVAKARLEVYQLDPKTGKRLPKGLRGLFTLAADGSWGPFRADGTATYEFAVVRSGEPVHHFYYQPFRRTDRLVRLLTSRPDQEIGGGMKTDAKQTDLVVSRGLEWWGDQGGDSDILTVDGTNVLSPGVAPRSKLALAVYLFDRDADGVSDVMAPIPDYFGIGFITGADLHIPAGDRSVEVAVTPRGQAAHRAVLRVPAWPSDTDRVTVHFRDDD